MSARAQRVCVWAGVAMVPVFFVGLAVIARFVPPPAPSMSAEAVARMYADHHDRIRVGVFVAVAAASLLAPFFATIGVQMRRIEGRHSVLAYIQMMLGACLVLVFVVPMFTWQAAAFRPERAAEVTQALNDLAWLPFVGIVGTFLVQAVVIAVAILNDTRAQPVFPRWAGYLNAWVAVGVVPGAFVVFFKDGPLAWNGVLGWWLIISCFFVWLCVMAALLWRAIAQQEREDAAPPTGADPRVDRLEQEVAELRAELAHLRRSSHV